VLALTWRLPDGIGSSVGLVRRPRGLLASIHDLMEAKESNAMACSLEKNTNFEF